MQKIIYSFRIMTQLALKGFQPAATLPNPKNPKYNCWVYFVTPELQHALDEVFRDED